MNIYEPELGQFLFGQPFKKYGAPLILIAALEYLGHEIVRVMQNIDGNYFQNPFENTANNFVCDAFEVYAYSWNEDIQQDFNFKCGDVEVSWYKYLGRGTSVNKQLSNDEIADLFYTCLNELYTIEAEHCKEI